MNVAEICWAKWSCHALFGTLLLKVLRVQLLKKIFFLLDLYTKKILIFCQTKIPLKNFFKPSQKFSIALFANP